MDAEIPPLLSTGARGSHSSRLQMQRLLGHLMVAVSPAAAAEDLDHLAAEATAAPVAGETLREMAPEEVLAMDVAAVLVEPVVAHLVVARPVAAAAAATEAVDSARLAELAALLAALIFFRPSLPR